MKLTRNTILVTGGGSGKGLHRSVHAAHPVENDERVPVVAVDGDAVTA